MIPPMIPPPTIIRSKKRKRTVALHVKADGSITVTAPMRTSLIWINAFIVEKAAWIARRRAAWLARQAAPTPELKDGCLVPFLGKKIPLAVRDSCESSALPMNRYREGPLEARGDPSPQIDEKATLQKRELDCHALQAGLAMTQKDDSLSISIPFATFSEKELQAEIKTELTLWYKKQARRVLAERMTHWAAQIGVTPKRLIITAPRARWGSCSAKDEIRLNWRLIMASPAILDYVIVHELCHIPHKNHGKRFWALVEKFIPNAKKIRQDLRIFEKSPFHALFS